MKKTSLFASLMCVLISTCAFAAGGTLPGSGSEAAPYLIEDLADFDTFADSANAATYWAAGVHTKLTTDIDLSGRTYTTAVVAPDTDPNAVGFQGAKFQGVFDGNDHSISNLTIHGPNNNYIALFGWVYDSQIRHLDLINVDILGNEGIGGLIGYDNGNIIDDCHVSGQVSGDRYVGGLAGNAISDIYNSSSAVEITGNDYVGGFAGVLDNHITIDCFSTGNVMASGDDVGGFVGNTGPITTYIITNCYATGEVEGNNSVGGFAGYLDRNVYNCYSTGPVIGNHTVGGFAGTVWHSRITNCYSTGSVKGNSICGGFAGSQPYWLGGFVDCFWDIESSELSDGVGWNDPDPEGVMGRTTSEMMMQGTFTGWDFTTPVWRMLRPGEDYPRLAWQEIFMGDVAGLYGVDMVDFAYLANYWGLTGCNSGTDCGRADIDTSDDVGLGDLVYIAQDWLK